MDLSIIVVNRNGGRFLKQCLQSVRDSLAPDASWEVFVVDNGSTDGSVEWVRRECPWVRVVTNQLNLGFPAANNRGVTLSEGRFVLFLNPDTVMQPGSNEVMLRFMRETPEAGAATCDVRLPSGHADDAAHRGFPTPWNALCHFSGLSRLFPHTAAFAGYSLGWKDRTTIHEIDALAGAYMLVRREAGESVGWWDEDYFFYGDDIDFCYRLKQARWRIYFVPDVYVVHHKGTSSGIRAETRTVTTADQATRVASARARFESMRIFYHKHYEGRRYRSLTGPVLFAIRVKQLIALWRVTTHV